MPRRADRSLAVSLCIAVAVHVLLALVTIESQIHSLRTKLEEGTLFDGFAAHRAQPEVAWLVPESIPEIDPEQPWRLFGEHDGTGEGTHRAEGDVPLAGLLSTQDQPFLSRDPVGPGDIGNLPSASLEPQGDFGTGGEGEGGQKGQRVLASGAAPADAPLVLFGPQVKSADRQPVPPKHSPPRPAPPVELAMSLDREKPVPPVDVPPEVKPDVKPEVKPEVAPDLAPATPTDPVSPVPPSPPPMPPAGAPDSERTGGRAGSDRAPADPAPMSDSEVDAFSRKKGDVFIRAGKVEPRLGRKVKTVRPRLNLASLGSILSMPDPVLRVGIRFDETGKVQHVTVLESSGSNELDQPTVVALYEWWFEPLPDKAGKPQGDTVVLSINFR